MTELAQLPPDFNYGENDHQILQLWKELGLYRLLEEQNKDGELFRFMDGPPFVSSSNLHYGHVHVSCCKSVVVNYQSMLGKRVLNKLGYDCHGLPIEMVVNKKLGIETRADVEKMGIGVYNQKCREVIAEFSGSWQGIFERLGRMADFENEYKTMDFPFMETVWWVFKQLWDKGLVYRGYKVMPYSVGCQTALSNFEASNAYAEKQDPAIYVKFAVVGQENTYLVAWTTTPWTLPANLALCVNSNMNYVKIRDEGTGEYWIVAEGAADKLYELSKKQKKSGQRPYSMVSEIPGSQIVGWQYEPILPYYADREFRVLDGSHVTPESGTGIVHTAPAHGEDDFNVCIKHGVVDNKEIGNFCPVDDEGKYTDRVSDYHGVDVFEANDLIIKRLKEEGKLVRKEVITHNYPFCWRTDTPLIYRAVSSYFIAVTKIRDQILANNDLVNWIPEHIGKGRFYQWLSNLRDWGVSRSRFFGTPLPIWVSDDGEESVCVGSAEELQKLAGLDKKPQDLHREFTDDIKIPSSEGRGNLQACQLVFDCWFESGSVPFGQIHYPFENKEILEGVDFMSDFICEGVDQTRGWFYTLLVLSTALTGKPAYKNCICTGLILAEDGKKFSKRLGNFVDPRLIMDRYGADALRLYLTQSPAARADSFKFSETDIEMILRKFVQWVNGYKFFIEHYTKFMKDGNVFDNKAYLKTTNVMDRWIQARTGTLVRKIREAMDSFEIYHVTYEIMAVIEDMTNWYIKFNRNRVRGRNCTIEDQTRALSTMWYTYYEMVKATAPFAPFLSETMYQGLCKLADAHKSSVLLETYPKVESFVQDPQMERKMRHMQHVASMVRSVRAASGLATTIKMPVKRAVVAHERLDFLDDIKELERYFKEETNVLRMEYRGLGGVVSYRAVPDNKRIGLKYRKLAGQIREAISQVDNEVLKHVYETKTGLNVTVDGTEYVIERDEFELRAEIQLNTQEGQLDKNDGGWYVMVDFNRTQEIIDSYLVRMFVTTVQGIRKHTKLHPWNKIKIYYQTDDKNMNRVLQDNRAKIGEDLIYDIYPVSQMEVNEHMIVSQRTQIDNIPIEICLTDPTGDFVASLVAAEE